MCSGRQCRHAHPPCCRSPRTQSARLHSPLVRKNHHTVVALAPNHASHALRRLPQRVERQEVAVANPMLLLQVHQPCTQHVRERVLVRDSCTSARPDGTSAVRKDARRTHMQRMRHTHPSSAQGARSAGQSRCPQRSCHAPQRGKPAGARTKRTLSVVRKSLACGSRARTAPLPQSHARLKFVSANSVSTMSTVSMNTSLCSCAHAITQVRIAWSCAPSPRTHLQPTHNPCRLPLRNHHFHVRVAGKETDYAVWHDGRHFNEERCAPHSTGSPSARSAAPPTKTHESAPP